MRTIHAFGCLLALAATHAAGQFSPADRLRQEREERLIQELQQQHKPLPPVELPQHPMLQQQQQKPPGFFDSKPPAKLEWGPLKDQGGQLRDARTKPRPQAAPPPPPPSRVVYGETRKLSGPREPVEEAAPKPAPKPAARPAGADKPDCVFKPVMTDADLAACR